MKERTLFIVALIAVSALFIAEWPPHIAFFLSIGSFLMVNGADIILSERAGDEFAVKLHNITIKLNNLGLVLVLLAILVFLFPFSGQNLVDLGRIDTLVGYKKLNAKDLHGTWTLKEIRHLGQKFGNNDAIDGRVEFFSFNEETGAIFLELYASRFGPQGDLKNSRLYIKSPFKVSFSRLLLDDAYSHLEGIIKVHKNTLSTGSDTIYAGEFCSPEIDILKDASNWILRTMWKDCYELTDNFQIIFYKD